MSDEVRLCQMCKEPISAERLAEVPVARRCAACVHPRPCERCKQMIPVERLDVYPETRVCVACSRETGPDTGLIYTTENTGKAGSLKKGTEVVGKVKLARRKPRGQR